MLFSTRDSNGLPVVTRNGDRKVLEFLRNQCCGSMKFCMDPDPDSDTDPAIFVTYLQDVNKKLFFYKVFLLVTF